MTWDDSGESPAHALLRDLEMQADGLDLADREAEVDELRTAQYAEVDLLGRLHASIGLDLRAELIDGAVVHGSLQRVGSGWFQIEESAGLRWSVRTDAVLGLHGLAAASVPVGGRPIDSRLPLRSALRRLAEDRCDHAFHLRGGRVVEGMLTGVGADFADLVVGESRTRLCVPLGMIAAVRSRAW